MDSTSLIYLDHAATTPVDPLVAEAMWPYVSEPLFAGNPSSIHSFGRRARAAVDVARDAVAGLIGCDYSEIYFTSSGTESDNLAIIGTVLAAPPMRDHVVTAAIEHHAVLHTAAYLERQGTRVTVLPVDDEGRVDPQTVADAVDERTALVSVMLANNEIGTIQNVAEIAQIAHNVGALLHTDAVQAVGQIPVDVTQLGCDLLTLCAHKIYGPKGAGALYVKSGTKVEPILHGGTQEREKRAGTENVPAIVGFGRAAELARERLALDPPRIASLRDRLLARLRASVTDIRRNGPIRDRLPNNLNVSVAGVSGPNLLMSLDREGIAASSGSACSSGSIEPSHVLNAIGLSEELASSGIRFSLGRNTTDAEIERTAKVFAEIVMRTRLPSPGGGEGQG